MFKYFVLLNIIIKYFLTLVNNLLTIHLSQTLPFVGNIGLSLDFNPKSNTSANIFIC